MNLQEEYDRLSSEYAAKGKCLEAARELVNSIEGGVEKILIVTSVASSDEKFDSKTWPFHSVLVGFDNGAWFAGAPGSGELHVDRELKNILEMLRNEFGGMWPTEEEVLIAMAEGKKELEFYADDLVC